MLIDFGEKTRNKSKSEAVSYVDQHGGINMAEINIQADDLNK
jgi:hypothetical protein